METRLLVGGELIPGDGPPLEVENPFDESTVATVGAASAAQVAAAVAAADEAAPAWGRLPAAERAELLHEIARRLTESTGALADLMTAEGGKPRVENADEVSWAVTAFQFYAELARAEQAG